MEERATPAASPARTVQYRYTSYPPGSSNGITSLTSVEYFGDSSLTAAYTYQNSDAGGTNPPLIKTCDDSMYGGAMSSIAYLFQGSVHGTIQSENHYARNSGVIGTVVSALELTDSTRRSETRGDGPSRSFTYAGGLLANWTDFKGVPAQQGHAAGFLSSSTDERGYVTTFQRNSITGMVEKIVYPVTESEQKSRTGSLRRKDLRSRWRILLPPATGMAIKITVTRANRITSTA